MTRLQSILSLICAACIIASCGSEKGESLKTRHFPQPKVPSMLQDEKSRAEFSIKYYWDALLDTASFGSFVNDSLHAGGVSKNELEQAMANYVSALSTFPEPLWEGAINHFYDKLRLCDKAFPSSRVFDKIQLFAENYMYDPNSPIRNEDLYGNFLENMALDPALPDSVRTESASEAALCRICRVGTKAPDFHYNLSTGWSGRLYWSNYDYTILFFSNPGCKACKEIIDILSQNAMVNNLVSSSRAIVLNIYVDEDLGEWYNYMDHYPTTWENGYDDEHLIRDKNLYHLRAIPSLYLLAKDKVVVLKDTTPQILIQKLEMMENIRK